LNEQQAYMAIRNAIRLENLGRNAAAKVTPELVAVMKQVRAAIEAFPSEALIREAAFKRFLQQTAPLFRGVNDHFLQTLSAELRREVVEQAKAHQKAESQQHQFLRHRQ